MDNERTYMVSENSSLTCSGCGRNFAQSNAYSNHIGSCRPGKKRMASALEVAQEAYRKKKRSRLDSFVTPSQPQPLQPSQLAPEPTVDVSILKLLFVKVC